MKPQPDWSALLRRDAPPPPDPAAAARTVALLRTLPPPRPTGWAFVWRQAGYIRKRSWAVQFALLAGIVALSAALPPDPGLYSLWAAAAPLLLVATVQDLARVYCRGMVEIELATRYSLARVTAARLLVFGLCDAGLLAVLALAGAAISRTALWVVLLYCLTPFCAVSALCLALLRRVRPAVFAPAALGAVLGAALVLALPAARLHPRLYAPEGRIFWAAALVLALAALAWQTRQLTRQGLPAALS